jgi:hypothetical protein
MPAGRGDAHRRPASGSFDAHCGNSLRPRAVHHPAARFATASSRQLAAIETHAAAADAGCRSREEDGALARAVRAQQYHQLSGAACSGYCPGRGSCRTTARRDQAATWSAPR